MITMMALAVAWLAGGGLLLAGMVREATNAEMGECPAGARRAEPAALVALALFIMAWPAVWLMAHDTK